MDNDGRERSDSDVFIEGTEDANDLRRLAEDAEQRNQMHSTAGPVSFRRNIINATDKGNDRAQL